MACCAGCANGGAPCPGGLMGHSVSGDGSSRQRAEMPLGFWPGTFLPPRTLGWTLLEGQVDMELPSNAHGVPTVLRIIG